MIDAKVLMAALKARDYTRFCGVPCSYFADVYRAIEAMPGCRMIANSNEGSAYAMAAGFAVAGERCAVFLQNSGLGNLVNPLTSLVMPYGIPLLAFVSVRGWATSSVEEAQHLVMGRSTASLLDAVDVANFALPASGSSDETVAALEEVLDAADRVLAQRRPAFVLVPPGVFGASAKPPAGGPDLPLDRRAVLSALARELPGALFVTTTGYTSRDMFGVADRPENLYLQGSMGHAVSVALGVALAQPDRQVVAIDGDGSAIMHMGAMSTVGACRPANLVHVVLDNGTYESTGGQPTTALNTGFPDIARACGYQAAITVDDLGQLTGFLSTGFTGPALVHARIGPNAGAPGARATAAVGPMELASRFSAAAGAPDGRALGNGHDPGAAGRPVPAPRTWTRNLPPLSAGRPPSFDAGSLSANEAVSPPSPRAAAAVADMMVNAHRYPDGGVTAFREAVAAAHDVAAESVVAGSGSEELLRLLLAGYGSGATVVLSDPACMVHERICAMVGARVVRVPLRDWIHDLEAMSDVCGDVALICNPHNPTGTAVRADALRSFLTVRKTPLVVVDEAYIDFADDAAATTVIRSADERDDLVVVRTLSKLYGLAGLRIGYLVGAPGVVATVRRSQQPFSPSGPAQAAGATALADTEHAIAVWRTTADMRAQTTRTFTEAGFTVVPSQANFVFVLGDENELVTRLAAGNVAVRPGRTLGVPGSVRVTVPDRTGLLMLRSALGLGPGG